MGRKQDEDGEEQPEEREGARPLDEFPIVPFIPEGFPKGEARQDGGAQRDPEEHGDAPGHDRIAYYHLVFRSFPDDVDEQDGDWGIEYYLEDGVKGDEYGAIFAVAAGEVVPY